MLPEVRSWFSLMTINPNGLLIIYFPYLDIITLVKRSGNTLATNTLLAETWDSGNRSFRKPVYLTLTLVEKEISLPRTRKKTFSTELSHWVNRYSTFLI